MTTVDPSTTLAHLLQRQITSAARHRTAAPAQATPAAASAIATAAAARIRAIDPDDPDRRNKALRVFLECVLQQAFGPQAVHDPNFTSMLDAVQQQMREDPKMADAADALARVLVDER